jgi:hypothetical protein
MPVQGWKSIAPSFCQRLACILDMPRSGRNVTSRDISSEVGRGANRAPSDSRVSPRCGHVSQAQLAAVKLLIVDELGYVPLSQTGAELLAPVPRRSQGSS